jgi:ELWxxDGT repeat protein
MFDPDGVVLFAAYEPGVGITLWRAVPAQGTATRIHTVAPPACGAWGARVLLRVRPATGSEPWQTDGTPEGTRLLADVVPGPQSSTPEGFPRGGSDGVLFALRPGPGARAVEGPSEGGAALVKDIWPGAEHGLLLGLYDARALGDRLLFRAETASRRGALVHRWDGRGDRPAPGREARAVEGRGVGLLRRWVPCRLRQPVLPWGRRRDRARALAK